MLNKMNKEFTEKMKGIRSKVLNDIVLLFKDHALEAHIFGSIARGADDALSDIDIWITFDDEKIKKIIEERMSSYATFGEIILLHEMQNNFPLDGIQTAIIYKIDGELIRVDFYLCPFSSSRMVPDSEVLFEKKKIEIGTIISETKRTSRDLSDRITFFLSMCFNGIKKIMRGDKTFTDFLISEFQKYEKEIPELSDIPKEPTFDTLRKTLMVLNTVSNPEQQVAVSEINKFMKKVELLSK